MKKNMSKKNISLWATGFIIIVLCAGCSLLPSDKAQQPPPPPAAPGPAVMEPTPAPPPPAPAAAPAKPVPEVSYYVHTVKWRGESVSIIAGWYTGDIQNWKVLAEHNPDINPNRIFEGNKIKIPENMMKTKTPMTKEYVDSFYTKSPKAAPGKPAAAPDKEDEPKLFGPKDYPGKY